MTRRLLDFLLTACGFAVALLGVATFPRPIYAAETPESLLQKSRSVLAQVDGELALPGLKEPVEVLRDRWGVPHLYAKNQDDLFFAQGFVTAQDRLFQMDLWRRVALGETAEVIGRKGLEGDRFARLLKYRGNMESEWTSYSPDAQRIAAAFARGINAYIDSSGDRLPVEFQILGTKPKKWQPEDCLGRMSGIIMCRNLQSEVSRAELVQAVGAEKARQLAPTDPPRDFGFAPGLDGEEITRAILEGYNAATRAIPFELPQGGSNNWVIDGTLSTSGKPILANDPHRNIALPSLRYLVHLNAPGWNAIGAGEPGVPGVAVGHNERIAWGFTIVGTDQCDTYVEETNPDNPNEYKAGGQWQKMEIVHEKVNVLGEPQPVDVELRFTRHGPVLHHDVKRQRAYALRWVGSEPGTAAYLGSLAIARAQNWPGFVTALRSWKLPGENMVYADVDGNIGWVATALTPIRKGWDGLLPVPGAEGKYEWQGYLGVEQLPQAHNPPIHYIATANHNILPPGYGREIAYEWAPHFRFARIKQRMEAKQKLGIEDFQSIQHDNTSLAGQTLARLAQTVDLRSTDLKLFVELLATWDGDLSRESRAGPLYGIWLQELLQGFYQPHVPERLLTYMKSARGIEVMLPVLEKPSGFWFGADPVKGRDELVRKTFAQAVEKTKAALGNDPSKWAWGKLHTTLFRHPLAGLGQAYEKAFNLGPVPRSGDGLTPNAASHNDKFQQISGASYRQIFDLADWDRGVVTSVPGQSGQPGSPHYGDLLALWGEGQYFPLAYSRGKVEQVTQHRLLLRPAK